MAKSDDDIEIWLKNDIKKNKSQKYELHLYIAGLTPKSQKAISNVKKLCDEHLKGNYELIVHDIYKNPNIAKKGQILAAPTLIKKMPLPLRRFIGDMANTEKLVAGLDLRIKEVNERKEEPPKRK